MKYKAYSLRNYRNIPQIHRLSKEQMMEIDVVGRVFPFRTNNYVVDELIDWDNFEDDPFFILNFPQKDMLSKEQFDTIRHLVETGASGGDIAREVNGIRLQLNPHPAGQMEHNVPEFRGEKLMGIQHKYRETMLFFPTQGQTCHAYCTFCFRWPQFSGMDNFKFAMKQADLLVSYLEANPSITDLLITGGDPMTMSASNLSKYIDAVLRSKSHNLTSIRIGTKSLSFWPYRYLTDKDSDDLLDVFERITSAGYNLALMAHINHPRELSTDAVKQAVKRIRSTGAVIRSQSPLLKHINDRAELWSRMWRRQVEMGVIPYYMFMARDTGAQEYFGVPLVDAWKIYRKAVSSVSGLARTVRGPSMSASPGKVQVLGVSDIKGEKVFVLNFLQGRNPAWVGRPFFARFSEEAAWLDELEPIDGEDEFFFEEEFREMLSMSEKPEDIRRLDLYKTTA